MVKQKKLEKSVYYLEKEESIHQFSAYWYVSGCVLSIKKQNSPWKKVQVSSNLYRRVKKHKLLRLSRDNYSHAIAKGDLRVSDCNLRRDDDYFRRRHEEHKKRYDDLYDLVINWA